MFIWKACFLLQEPISGGFLTLIAPHHHTSVPYTLLRRVKRKSYIQCEQYNSFYEAMLGQKAVLISNIDAMRYKFLDNLSFSRKKWHTQDILAGIWKHFQPFMVEQ